MKRPCSSPPSPDLLKNHQITFLKLATKVFSIFGHFLCRHGLCPSSSLVFQCGLRTTSSLASSGPSAPDWDCWGRRHQGLSSVCSGFPSVSTTISCKPTQQIFVVLVPLGALTVPLSPGSHITCCCHLRHIFTNFCSAVVPPLLSNSWHSPVGCCVPCCLIYLHLLGVYTLQQILETETFTGPGRNFHSG